MKGTTTRVFELLSQNKGDQDRTFLLGALIPEVIPGSHLCSSEAPRQKESPVTNAKEVAVGNRAEETYCHRTISFLTELLVSR